MLPICIRILKTVADHIAIIGVGGNFMAFKPIGDLVGIALGKRVNNPRSGQLVNMVHEPRKTSRLRWKAHGLQCQRCPGECPTLDADIA